MHTIKCKLQVGAGVLMLLCLFAPTPGRTGPVWSADGRVLARAVPIGQAKALMTAVWTVEADGTGARRVGLYAGRPGGVGFLPGNRGLVYLERGLLYGVFGSYLCGGRELPLVKNRIWRLAADGSGETSWPLPEDLNPLEMAVAPDGRRLAVVDGGGLWTVDETGRATLLISGQVTGPLRWSGRSISCLVDGVAQRVGADGGRAPAAGAMGGPGAPGEGPGLFEDRASEVALPLMHQALNWWMRGYRAMHQGEYWKARQGYEEAVRGMEALGEKGGESGISTGSCLGYAAVFRAFAEMDEAGFEETVCREHMLVLGDFFADYGRAHGGYFPPDLQGLRAWVEGKIGQEARDGKIRKRDLSVLDRLVRCPAASGPYVPEVGYFYRPGAGLSCYWHPGRALRLVSSRSGYRVEALDLGPEGVDSLYSEAHRRLESGDAAGAVFWMRAVAHQRLEDQDTHMQLGHAYLKAGKYAAAEWAFKRAASLEMGDAEPYYGLGLVHMELPNKRYRAISFFREALIRDRHYVDAQYQIARARYLMNEHDAKPEIERVLKMDPTYGDAYLLIGDWYAHFSQDFAQAVVWYTKYLALRPNDPEGQRKLGLAYLKVKDYDRILEQLQAFVQAYPDAVELMPIVAQACVKKGELGMAMGFFASYLSRLPAKIRALYEDISPIASPEELAEYAHTSGVEREAFSRRFWNGRDPDLTTPVNERLLEHYRRVWYASVAFSGGKQPWDRRGDVYIRFGEPDHRSSSRMMDVPRDLAVIRVKERLAANLYGTAAIGEMYTGPVFPVRNFSLQRDVLGFEADLGFEMSIEEELEGTDAVANLRQDRAVQGERQSGGPSRGEHYVAEGQDEVGGVQARAGRHVREDGSDEAVPAGSDENNRAVAAFGPDGRSARARGQLFQDDSSKLTDYRPVTATGEDHGGVPWESWVYLQVDGGIEISFTDEFGKGIYDYAPVPMSPEVSAAQMARFVRHAPERTFAVAASVSPDHYVPEYEVPPFDFYYSLADFRGRDGRSVLEVYYGIPRPPRRYAPGEDVTRVVKRQVALIPTTLDTVYRKTGEVAFQVSGGPKEWGTLVPDLVRMEVPPGVYRLEVKAQDRMDGRLGIYRQRVVVEGYGGDRLRVSDLELAWRVAEAKTEGRFGKAGLEVIPMPSRTYRAGQSVFVYYEVYNLEKDEFGQAKYRVAYTVGRKVGGIISRLVQTLTGRGRKEEVAVGGYKRAGLAASEAVYTELDLGEAKAGRHYLRVEVTDLNSGRTAAKETGFVVSE